MVSYRDFVLLAIVLFSIILLLLVICFLSEIFYDINDEDRDEDIEQ